MLQWCFFYANAKDPNHGIKIRQNFAFLFSIPFILCLSVFDLFSMSTFSKIVMMDSLDILSLGTSSKNFIKWSGLCVIKRTAIFKEHIYYYFVSEALRSNSPKSCHNEALKKKFPGEASLRKVLSLHFDFIWNKFYVQNANAYAITNFLLYNLILIKSCSACSKQNCKQCLFNVSNLDIMWSSMTTPGFIFY